VKIQEQEVDVTMSENLNEDVFYIQATPEAFEALSGGLYNNRILAPIRELSANAYDSHVDAGCPEKPFEIHGPTSLDPTFYIRDYGTGLSEEKVDKVFRGYFNSTKKNSNDYVGCLGLGSKSPFAYVQSFTVKSFYNGKCYIYNCYKNSKNCPAITKIGELETDEPNGLHISFPVKDSDFYSFRSEISKNFTFYKVKPIVTGINNFSFSQPEYILSNDKFGITKSKSSSLVVMGNIAYPFSSSQFKTSDSSFSSDESKIVNWGIHLFVPIGSVNIASSREALSYTEATMKTIKEHVEIAALALREEVSKTAMQIPTIWDARLYCNSVSKNVLMSVINDNNYSNNFTINWKGKTVSNYVEVNKLPNPPSSTMAVALENGLRYSNRDVISLKRNNITTIHARESLIIFVNDMNIGAYAAVNRYMTEKDMKNAIIISNDYGKDFLEELGIPKEKVVFASTIEKPERKPRTVGGVKVARTTLQKYVNGSFENVEVDLNSESGLYFEVKRGEVKISEKTEEVDEVYINSHNVNQLFSSLKILGFNEQIYAVRPCDLEKIKSKSNWKPALPEISKFMLSMKAEIAEVSLIKSYESLSDETRVKLNKYSRISADIAVESCEVLNNLTAVVKTYKAAKSVSMNTAFRTLNSMIHVVNYVQDTKEMISCIKSFEEKYPMLKYVGGEYGINGSRLNDVKDYVMMLIDKPVGLLSSLVDDVEIDNNDDEEYDDAA
jgi:hypothetical protein